LHCLTTLFPHYCLVNDSCKKVCINETKNMVMQLEYFVVLSFSILHKFLSHAQKRQPNKIKLGEIWFVFILSMKLHTLTDMGIFHQRKEENASQANEKTSKNIYFYWLQQSKINIHLTVYFDVANSLSWHDKKIFYIWRHLKEGILQQNNMTMTRKTR